MQAIEMYAQVSDQKEIHLKLPDDIFQKQVKVIVLYDEKQQDEFKKKKRIFGQYKGRIHISEDFDAPLPDSFWLGEDE